MTESNTQSSPLSLTMLKAIYDACEARVYVHPDDASHSIIETFRKNGYRIEHRPHMTKGKLWFQNAGSCGVFDLIEGAGSIVHKNPMAETLNAIHNPPLPKSFDL